MKKQWNFSTYDEMAKDLADRIIKEHPIEGKTLEEWIDILKEYLATKKPDTE